MFTVVLSVIGSAIAPTFIAAPAHADPQATIASKAAEAKRLEAQITANGDRVSMLDEQYNQTLLHIDNANNGLADAQARINTAKSETGRLNGLLAGRAAQLYTQAGSRSPFPELDASSMQELGARAKYSDAAAQHDDILIAQASAARELLRQRQGELKHARAQAEAQKKALEQQRGAVQAAVAKQQQLLSHVKGDLVHLVRQEQARQQRAADAAARAAFQARVAQQQAARQLASRTDGAGNGSNGSNGSNGPVSSSPGLAAPNVPAPSSAAQTAIDTAKAQLGKPYVYAAAGPNSFDCSGLTMFAWAAAGVQLPHSAEAQFQALPHVPMDALAPGDLVFFGNPIHHVGMYLGGGTMIQAPQTGDVVKISSAYRRDFAGAARP
ncbi:MAG: peptidoglycan DL-endopeptidase CwlO [Actinomycetota bacterium]|nr:peptidoglycan DL-endopeptidase CwlO [Actinomycetota bacterium]